MPIINIGRYFSTDPNIVGIVTTDDLATITTTHYITTQQPYIEALNNGPFEWSDTDMILIHFSPNLVNWFVRDEDTNTFETISNDAGNVTYTGDLVVNNIPVWESTNGVLKDSGLSVGSVTGTLGNAAIKTPSNDIYQTVAMVAVTPSIGDVAIFNDIGGSLISGSQSGITVAGLTVIDDAPGSAANITCENTSPVAGSGASLQLITTSNVSGAEGGSPTIYFTLENYTTWIAGLWSGGDGGDNNFHIKSGGAPFTSNDLIILQSSPNQLTVNGNLYSAANICQVKSVANGIPNYLWVENLSTDASSGAQCHIRTTSDVSGTTGGSPSIVYEQNNFAFWQIGIWSIGDGGDNALHFAHGNFSSSDLLIVNLSPSQFIFNANIYSNMNVCQVKSSASGFANTFTCENTATTANSDAELVLVTTNNVGGTIGGSPLIRYYQNNFQFFQSGIWSSGNGGDNNFHISSGFFSSSDPVIIDSSTAPNEITFNGNVAVNGNLTPNQLMYETVSVTTTGSLNTTAFGKLILFNGSTSITVTLPNPSGNANSFIYFQNLIGSFGRVTLNTPGGQTIDLVPNYILTQGETSTIFTDGNNYWIYSSKKMIPSLICSGTQSIPNSTPTALQFATPVSDNFNFWSGALYLPLYAGLYQVTATVNSSSGSASSPVLSILKNATPFKTINGSNLLGISATEIVYLNGSTDFIIAEYTQNSGGSATMDTYLSIVRLANNGTS